TCKSCNSGWMSKIESASKSVTLALMRGEPTLLGTIEQVQLASLLCLITMRNELSYFPRMVAIPADDRDCLRTTLQPPWRGWKIWIAKPSAATPTHWAYHAPMHIDSADAETGPDKVNTQTTTMVMGRLCVHAFSSSEIAEDINGYRGVRLTRIWPLSGH